MLSWGSEKVEALITGFHPQLPGTAPFLSSQGVLNALPGRCLATVPSPPAPPHFSPLELGCAASPGHGSQGMRNPGLSGLRGKVRVREMDLGGLQIWEKTRDPWGRVVWTNH